MMILLCGCMTFGKPFKSKNISLLELGKIKNSEYKTIFGNPDKLSVEKNIEGNYEKAFYYHGGMTAGFDILSRMLYLEFKDGILNGYYYISEFKNDKSGFNPTNVTNIEINKSTKSDALKILGNPTGKAKCPTTLYSSKEKCEPGDEIWSWGRLENGKHAIFSLTFDNNSTATNIRLVDEQ